jgi:beta-lactamase superfamily II metal-dependent hydrolase
MSSKIYFIWVGQGDCTLIRTDTNKLILIDCGTSDDQSVYSDNVKPTIEAVLKDAGKTSIDYLILTHSDKDHCNLIQHLLKFTTFGTAYYGGSAFQYKPFKIDFTNKKQIKAVKDLESHYTNLFIDTVVDDTDFKLWIIGANFPYNQTPPDVPYEKDINRSGNRTKAMRSIYDNNGNSLMVVLNYKGFKVFFLGDATTPQQDFIYEAAKTEGKLAEFAVKVFKMSHHGSPDSFSDDLTNKAAKPPVLTASAGVTFGHPSEQTVDTVKSLETTGAVKHDLVLYDTLDESYSRFNNVVKFMFNTMTWFDESSITVPTKTKSGKRSRDKKAGLPYLDMIGSNWLFELTSATTVNITQGDKKTILTTKGTESVTAKKKRKKGKGLVAAPPLRLRLEFQKQGPPRVTDLSGTPEEP